MYTNTNLKLVNYELSSTTLIKYFCFSPAVSSIGCLTSTLQTKVPKAGMDGFRGPKRPEAAFSSERSEH